MTGTALKKINGVYRSTMPIEYLDFQGFPCFAIFCALGRGQLTLANVIKRGAITSREKPSTCWRSF